MYGDERISTPPHRLNIYIQKPLYFQVCLNSFVVFIFILSVALFNLDSAAASNEETRFRDTLKLDEKWTGDFDEMVERRIIRALVTFSKTNYFIDKATQRGVTYELMKEFENRINKSLKKKHLKIHVVFIPVTRDKLLSALIEGRGDIAAAGLTITPGRKKLVDFADPFIKDIDEIIVAGPSAPKLTSQDDLPGKEIHVRETSSYYEHLVGLNKAFRKAGKSQIVIQKASEYLEDEDLLEMVNADLIPFIVVDSYLAEFWSQIFKGIKLYPTIAVNTGGEIAWMVRKNSPKLKLVINEFVKDHKKAPFLATSCSGGT